MENLKILDKALTENKAVAYKGRNLFIISSEEKNKRKLNLEKNKNYMPAKKSLKLANKETTKTIVSQNESKIEYDFFDSKNLIIETTREVKSSFFFEKEYIGHDRDTLKR